MSIYESSLHSGRFPSVAAFGTIATLATMNFIGIAEASEPERIEGANASFEQCVQEAAEEAKGVDTIARSTITPNKRALTPNVVFDLKGNYGPLEVIEQGEVLVIDGGNRIPGGGIGDNFEPKEVQIVHACAGRAEARFSLKSIDNKGQVAYARLGQKAVALGDAYTPVEAVKRVQRKNVCSAGAKSFSVVFRSSTIYKERGRMSRPRITEIGKVGKFSC